MARSLAPWLAGDVVPEARAVIQRALMDIGICEMPPGSNRSGRIDEYLRAVYTPESLITSGKGYWCAAATSAWWREGSLVGMVPYRAPALPLKVGSASCDVWMSWAIRTGRFVRDIPALGSLVLYGKPGDAQHIGLVVRTSPLILSVEGNTTVEGAAFGASREGVAVSLKEVTSKDPVLGYIHLFRREPR